jgi:hypothetical protein
VGKFKLRRDLGQNEGGARRLMHCRLRRLKEHAGRMIIWLGYLSAATTKLQLESLHFVLQAELQLLQPNFLYFFIFGEITLVDEGIEAL